MKTRLGKRTLSLFVAMLMLLSVIPSFSLTASATNIADTSGMTWTEIASSDFTQSSSVTYTKALDSSGSKWATHTASDYMPVADDGTAAIKWDARTWGNASSSSYTAGGGSNDGGDINFTSDGMSPVDGFIYLSGWEGSGNTPMNSCATAFKIELTGEFTNTTYYADGTNSTLMKISTTNTGLDNTALGTNTWFGQHADGVLYCGSSSSSPTNNFYFSPVNDTYTNPGTSEFTYTMIYDGTQVIAYVEVGGTTTVLTAGTANSASISDITALMFGNANDTYLRNMCYKTVKIYSGSDGGSDTTVDPLVTAVQSAMDQFETKLSSGEKMTNLVPAYNAYVACQQALDAYIYGGETDALDGKADALLAAIDDIGTFTQKDATESSASYVSVYNDDSTDGYTSDYSGVLWSETGVATDDDDYDGNAVSLYDNSAELSIYYPQVVFLYDGSTKLQSRIIAIAEGYGSNVNTRIISAIVPITSSDYTTLAANEMENVENNPSGDTPDLTVERNWKTGMSNFDYNWNEGYYNSAAAGNSDPAWISYNLTTESDTYTIKNYGGAVGAPTWNKNYQCRVSTQLLFSGYDGYDTLDANGTSGTKYFLKLYPYFKGCIGSSGTWSANLQDNVNTVVSGDNAIYVLDYKKTLTAIDEVCTKLKGLDVSNYSEGPQSSLGTLVNLMDGLTEYDPNDYFTETTTSTIATDVNKAAQAEKNLVLAESKATTTTTNSTYYAALRKAMSDAVRTTYAGGGSKYTEDSWSAFVTAYEAAQEYMAAVNDTTYDASGTTKIYTQTTKVTKAATALTEAYAALETLTGTVDTTDLVSVIDEFEDYVNIFTSSTYTAVANLVKAAKIAVWGSVSNYNIAADALENTNENQQIVDDYVTAIKAAIEDLRIDPAATITLTSGSYSLNTALELKDSVNDPSKYLNYSTLSDACIDATAYKSTLSVTPLTDYTTQYNAYVTYVTTIVNAYNNLTLSGLLNLKDGDSWNNDGTNTTTTLSSTDNKVSQYLGYTYTNGAYIYKVSHNTTKAAYGTFKIDFGTTILLINQGLDSITIDPEEDADAISDSKRNINNQSASNTGAGKSLTDDQKNQYAGCLTNGNFSIDELYYTGTSGTYDDPVIIVDQDGTCYTDNDSAKTVNLTNLLGTLEGYCDTKNFGSGVPTKVPYGCVMNSSDSNSDTAWIYVQGNLNYTIQGDTASTLSADTLPSLSEEEIGGDGAYIGAVTHWNLAAWTSTWYAGYNWFTTKINDEKCTTAVKVLDLSYLVDLVNTCNDILDDKDMYTATSWSNFTAKLQAAQSVISTNNTTTSTALNQLLKSYQTRYTNLWDAYQALELKTFDVDFTYKDASASDVTTTITVTYGETLSDHADEVNAIELVDYDYGNATYSFDYWKNVTANSTTVENPAYSDTTPITADIDYEAQYTATIKPASWDDYNAAQSALEAALTDDTYSLADLTALQTALSGLTYFSYTDDQKAEITAEMQTAIDEETATITALTSGLTAVTYDSSPAEAAAEIQKALGKADEDIYDDALTNGFEYHTQIEVAGKTVYAYIYATQDELDSALRDCLNNMTVKTYTIYCDGEALGMAEYGTPAVVGITANGAMLTLDVDTNTNTGTDGNYKWVYSYSAPSTDNEKTSGKYMITAPSFGFVVRGDTYLTTEKVEDQASGYTVTIKSSVTGKTIDMVTTDADGSFTMPDSISIPFYDFAGYSNGVAAGETATVSENTTITANYTAAESNTLIIDTFTSISNLYEGDKGTTYEVEYNTLVSLYHKNAYCWALVTVDDAGVYQIRVLSYEKTYEFYASESHEFDTDEYEGSAIIRLTKAAYQEIIENQTSITLNMTTELYEVSFDSSVDTVLADGNGNPILLTLENTGSGEYETDYPSLEPSVISDDAPVYTSDLTKFTLIGTFVCPDGYTIKENGFLFTSDTTAASQMTVENVGTNGIARFKASKYTVGNQFMINLQNPTYDAEFLYVPYSILTDSSGNIVTVYGTIQTASNEGSHN